MEEEGVDFVVPHIEEEAGGEMTLSLSFSLVLSLLTHSQGETGGGEEGGGGGGGTERKLSGKRACLRESVFLLPGFVFVFFYTMAARCVVRRSGSLAPLSNPLAL